MYRARGLSCRLKRPMNHFDAGKGIATKSINCEKMTDVFWFRKMLNEKPFL